jgi:hypothetical protein
MLAGFDWWLLILGVVAGGGLVWLLTADFARSDDDQALDEREREAAWIAGATALGQAEVARVLELHREHLAAGPGAIEQPGGSTVPAGTTDDAAGRPA